MTVGIGNTEVVKKLFNYTYFSHVFVLYSYIFYRVISYVKVILNLNSSKQKAVGSLCCSDGNYEWRVCLTMISKSCDADIHWRLEEYIVIFFIYKWVHFWIFLEEMYNLARHCLILKNFMKPLFGNEIL